MQVNQTTIDLSTLNVQKLSIQLLDISRTENYIKDAPSFTKKEKRPLEEIIYLIVEIYNVKQNQKKEPVPEDENLVHYSWTAPLSVSHFGRAIYTKTTNRKTRLATRTEHTSDTRKEILKSVCRIA